MMNEASHILTSWFCQDVIGRRLAEKLPLKLPEHCIGINRALGDSFIPVFLSDGAVLPATHGGLRRLIAVARACVVFDDMLRDQDMPHIERDVVSQCLARSIEVCQTLAGQLCGSTQLGANLVRQRLDQIDSTYSRLYCTSLLPQDKVFGRCALLGLPFDVMSSMSILSTDDTNTLLRCAKAMLFLLQLADDYADLDDDQASATRYNLILEKMPTPQFYLTHAEYVRTWTCLSIYGSALSLERSASDKPILQSWAKAVASQFLLHSDVRCNKLIEELFRCDPMMHYVSAPQMSCFSSQELRCIGWHNEGTQDSLCAENLHSMATRHALAGTRILELME